MSTWDDKLKAKLAQYSSTLKTAKKFYATYKPWLEKYRGGCPVGFLASTAAIESGGTMVAGDPDLGEYGFFQIAKHTESQYGLPSDFRKTPENNIFMAALEYNIEAKRLKLKYPNLIFEGTPDQWKLARCVFVFGNYGTDVLIKSASSYLSPGNVFNGIVKWANNTGSVAIGSSSAGKIWYRLNLIDKLNWPIGKEVTFQTLSSPKLPPGPGGIKYVIPKDVRDKFDTGYGPLLAAAAFIAVWV